MFMTKDELKSKAYNIHKVMGFFTKDELSEEIISIAEEYAQPQLLNKHDVSGWREFADDIEAYQKEVLWKNKKTGQMFIKAYYPYDPNLPPINDYLWMPLPA